MNPLISGGGQERARRGGTENVAAITSLGMVCEFIDQKNAYIEYVKALRDYFEVRVSEEIPDIQFNGKENPRVCNTSSVLVNGVDGETLLMNLDMGGVAISTGAACSSGNPEPSPVLLAMGLSRAEAQCSMRVSLGWGTTKQEIDQFLETLKKVVVRLRSLKEQ